MSFHRKVALTLVLAREEGQSKQKLQRKYLRIGNIGQVTVISAVSNQKSLVTIESYMRVGGEYAK